MPSALGIWWSDCRSGSERRGSYPLAEVAVVHLGRRHGKGGAVRPGAVAETLVGEEEEGLVLAAIDFGDPNRSTDSGAEIVLLVNGTGIREALLKKLLASRSLLRRNS